MKMFLVILYVNMFIYVAAKCSISIENGVKQAICQNQGLTAVPQDLPSDIQRLVLSDNNFTIIKEYSFSRYQSLKELAIDRNNLRKLDINAFHGLNFLLYLSMSDNELDVSDAYPKGVFESIASLLVLDIRHNMNETPAETFYAIPLNELRHLQELSIDLTKQPRLENCFNELYELKYIRFDFCYITKLQNDTFADLPSNITELNMTACLGNPLARKISIESNALRFFPSLSILDFTHSNFDFIQALYALYPLQYKTMKAILFRGLKGSEVIITKDNMKYITTICIETLDLSLNNIALITDDFASVWFKRPECFKTFLLSGNRFSMDRITFSLTAFFKRMSNLEVFDYSYVTLGYTNIVFLCVDFVKNNESVYECEYNNSHTDAISPSLQIPSNIKYLRFTHIMAKNAINKIIFINSSLIHLEMSYYTTTLFPFLIFEGYNNLQYLDISGISASSSINKLPFLEHLKVLIMRYTEIYKLIQAARNSIFHWAPNLQKLDLSFNYIWYIPSNFFGTLCYVTHLNLSNNMFAVVPAMIISLKNIIELDLSYNLITTVQENVRTWIDNQQINFGTFLLFLDKNSLACSCETYEFLSWITKTQSILDNKGNYSCWIPAGKGETSYTFNVVEDYHNYFIECNDKLWLKIGSSLLASSVTIVLVITLLYNFRWRIIFFVYRRFRKFAETGLNVDFNYDVYVSYSDDSVSFVKQVIAPKLEREWGLKMCCEDRDFVVGDSIADARADSIHCSRHIIFLVTPSFMQSEWSKFEIERAKYEKFSKDLQKIVVIAKDISINTIPFEFATFWKDICLIEWPIDQDGLNMTWQKLRLWFL